MEIKLNVNTKWIMTILIFIIVGLTAFTIIQFNDLNKANAIKFELCNGYNSASQINEQYADYIIKINPSLFKLGISKEENITLQQLPYINCRTYEIVK